MAWQTIFSAFKKAAEAMEYLDSRVGIFSPYGRDACFVRDWVGAELTLQQHEEYRRKAGAFIRDLCCDSAYVDLFRISSSPLKQDTAAAKLALAIFNNIDARCSSPLPLGEPGSRTRCALSVAINKHVTHFKEFPLFPASYGRDPIFIGDIEKMMQANPDASTERITAYLVGQFAVSPSAGPDPNDREHVP